MDKSLCSVGSLEIARWGFVFERLLEAVRAASLICTVATIHINLVGLNVPSNLQAFPTILIYSFRETWKKAMRVLEGESQWQFDNLIEVTGAILRVL